MRKVFSREFFIDSIRSVKVLAIIQAAIMILSTFSLTMPEVIGYLRDGNYFQPTVFGSSSFVFLSIWITIFVPIMVIHRWSYMTKRNESDFYDALHIPRSAMVLSGMLAIFVVSLIPLLFSYLIAWLITLPVQGSMVVFDIGSVTIGLVSRILALIIAIAIPTIAASITGTTLAAVITSGILLFAPRSVLSGFSAAISVFADSLIPEKNLPLLNYNTNVYTATLVNDITTESLLPIAYSTVLAIACTLIALIIFKNRKSENAGKAFTGFGKCCSVALLAAFASGVSASSFVGDPATLILGTISTLPTTVITYFIIVLIATWHNKKITQTVLSSFIIVAFELCFVIASLLAGNFLNARLTEREDIVSVSPIYFTNGIDWLDYSDYTDYNNAININRNFTFDSDEMLDLVVNAMNREDNSGEVYYHKVALKITGKGESNYRFVYFDNSEYDKYRSILLSDQEYSKCYLDVFANAKSYCATAGGYSFSSKKLGDLSTVLSDEIKNIGIDKFASMMNGETPSERAVFTYYLYDNHLLKICVPVSTSFEQSYNLLEDVRKKQAEADIAELKDLISKLSLEGNNRYVYINLWETDGGYNGVSVNIGENIDKLNDLLLYVDSSDASEGYCLSFDLYSEDKYYNLAVKKDAEISAIKDILKAFEE